MGKKRFFVFFKIRVEKNRVRCYSWVSLIQRLRLLNNLDHKTMKEAKKEYSYNYSYGYSSVLFYVLGCFFYLDF